MYAYVGSGSEPGSIQPKEGVCVSQHRMQDAENAGEGGEAVNKKRKSLSRKGGGVQWKEWHLHHNPTRTSIGILRLDETANDDDSQSTDEATIVVLLDDRDVLRYV